MQREYWVAYPFNGDGAFSIYVVAEDSEDGIKAAAEQMRLTTIGEGNPDEDLAFTETDFDRIGEGAEVFVDGIKVTRTEDDWEVAH